MISAATRLQPNGLGEAGTERAEFRRYPQKPLLQATFWDLLGWAGVG